MDYVLIIITVFTMTGSVATDTRFQEFQTRESCERARQGIEQGFGGAIKGDMGRELFTACFPKK